MKVTRPVNAKAAPAAKVRPGKAGAETKAGAADWIKAGLALLAQDGIDAVRVEPLAMTLGVTKGSFYWHFKDRAALHAAMLDAWRHSTTRSVIDHVEQESRDKALRLRHLIVLAAKNNWVARLETAVRAWARTDHRAAEAVAEIDGQRLDYVASLLRDLGIDARSARLRAQVLYLALIGSYFVEGGLRELSERAVWKEAEALIAGKRD